MPSFPSLFGFKIYFWSNEGKPLEDIHVHVTKDKPQKNATKFWILSNGQVELAENGCHFSNSEISKLKRALADYTDIYIQKWEEFHNTKATFHDSHN